MPRYKLIIEYDGIPFCGWQRQDQQPTVQGAIEEALFKAGGERVTIGAAGRTDTGVHGLGQVAHVSLKKNWPSLKLREALNYHLKPWPVAILQCEMIGPYFDARFSAKSRHYRYLIINRRAPLALQRNRAWHVRQRLDESAMHEAAQYLVGKHDFTTFRNVACQAKSPVKTLDRLTVERQSDEIIISTSATSFLHNQVRSMVGALVYVGDGHWTSADLKAALDAKNRQNCPPVAPPYGLYFQRVSY